MLPFGSITSIIPLFLLASAYVIYLSATFFSRHVPQENNVIEQEKTIYITKVNAGDPVDYPDFRSVDNGHDEFVAGARDFPLKVICCSHLYEISSGKPVRLHTISGFSPRPPPLA